MKKYMSLYISLFLLIFSVGFSVLDGEVTVSQSSSNNEIVEEVILEEMVVDQIIETSSHSNAKDLSENNDSSEAVSSVVKDDIKETNKLDMNSNSKTQNSNAEVKTLAVNNEKITLNFEKTEKAHLWRERGLKVYCNENNDTILKYDAKTDELLQANFEINEDESQKKITEKQAIKLVEAFVKEHCDLAEYTLDFVKSTMNEKYYLFKYSKHIQGYESEQFISVIISTNGQIKSYSHNKYVFEGIDTTVKINRADLDLKLKKLVNPNDEDEISYIITKRVVGVDEDNKLVMEHWLNKTSVSAEKEYTSAVIYSVKIA